MENPIRIVVDIETVPCDEQTRNLLPPINPQGNLKEENIAEWDATTLPNLKEKQFLETALDGTFGRIACIGLLIFDNTQHQGKVIYGTSERQILFEFWKVISQYKKILFVAHNGLNFDFPFILNRSIIHSIKPTCHINLARYRNDFIFDTMVVWANWDTRKFIKLDTLAQVLKVGEKNGNGSKVYSLWQEGKYKEIADYCFNDVYITYAVYCKMNFQTVIQKTSMIIEKAEFKQ